MTEQTYRVTPEARACFDQLMEGHSLNGTDPDALGCFKDILLQIAKIEGADMRRAFYTAMVQDNPMYADLGSAAVATPDNEQEEIWLLVREGEADEGNAQTVAKLYGDQFAYVGPWGWLYWTGTHWARETAEAVLDRAVVRTLKARAKAAIELNRDKVLRSSRPTATHVRHCKSLLQSILIRQVSDFEPHPDEINVRNGVLNLRTGQLTPHDPNRSFTYVCPVDYDPDADMTVWLDFLKDVLNDNQELINYLQEAVGYSLTGYTREEILFYLHGKKRAGKGTLTETLMAMLGEDLSTEVPFETFTASRIHDPNAHDLAGLMAKRLIIASESEQAQTLNTSRLKVLTGGNLVRCAFKYGDHFTYRPQYTVWLASNYPANADPTDDAAWYRLRVIHFPNSYAGREDKLLKQRLRQPANLSGVLRWAVEGAHRWYERGSRGLPTPDQVMVNTAAARFEVDPVGQWLQECVELTENPADTVTNRRLYGAYTAWAEDSGVSPYSKAKLTRELKARHIAAGELITDVNGKAARGAKGLVLTAYDPGPPTGS